jgi:hypothetical protein
MFVSIQVVTKNVHLFANNQKNVYVIKFMRAAKKFHGDFF